MVQASPEFEVRPGPLSRDLLAGFGREAVLALPIAPAGSDGGRVQPGAGAAEAATAYGIDLDDLAARSGSTGAVGEAIGVPLPALTGGAAPWDGLPGRIVLVGVGDGSTVAMRRAGAAVAKCAAGVGTVVTTLAADGVEDEVQPFVEGALLGSYRPPFTGTGTGPSAPVGRIALVGDADRGTVAHAEIAAGATLLTRTLAATPSNLKNPQWLADQVRSLARGRRTVKVTVHTETWLADRGLNGILAVGHGSVTPPRLVVVDHNPAGASGTPVVLVGKGITYDSGGISIKPRDAMIGMKTDMAGAAAVLGAVLGAARAELPVRVIGVLPLAENAFSGSSYRPGDVLTMVDGTTVEIGNTDAEGRLVLADAMAWARTEFEPGILVDVATLTGAASLGLGKRHGALYATADDLRDALVAAGELAGEPLWPMPLVEEYRHALDSAVADLSHITTDPHVSGGSITAALFLQHFAGATPWAHLDIAGPARSAKAEHEVTEGATGFGARVLLRWLQSLS
ncbi:leucyl aminopeptidase family protein [Occultella glacieicola]|uniref:Probable cytosol aminopeptidase n=1 Tax=Occultella glacieicola TaxID=2518684 RepID=A0ABY2ECG4_9MICO|nr:leucyl aminopeptidase family protein [Occultella glacieicola]TDE97524.1 leucyl aminopeptidase family protein [Occultella glacieicola]